MDRARWLDFIHSFGATENTLGMCFVLCLCLIAASFDLTTHASKKKKKTEKGLCYWAEMEEI